MQVSWGAAVYLNLNLSISLPSPCQSSQRWAAQALGEAVSLCRSEDVVGIGGATLGPPLGWRNRSTAFQSNSHGACHDKETSQGWRKCQGVKMMGPRLSAHRDVASSRQVLSGELHVARLHGRFLSPLLLAPRYSSTLFLWLPGR